MAKGKRVLDNIEKDVIAAMRLGYGVHYGNYKADHPHTRDVEPEEDVLPAEQSKTCTICGKSFLPSYGNRKTCSEECRKEAIRIRQRKKSAPTQAQCVFCGKTYQKNSKRHIYCSNSCCMKAHYAKKKQGQEVDINAQAMA